MWPSPTLTALWREGVQTPRALSTSPTKVRHGACLVCQLGSGLSAVEEGNVRQSAQVVERRRRLRRRSGSGAWRWAWGVWGERTRSGGKEGGGGGERRNVRGGKGSEGGHEHG